MLERALGGGESAYHRAGLCRRDYPLLMRGVGGYMIRFGRDTMAEGAVSRYKVENYNALAWPD